MTLGVFLMMLGVLDFLCFNNLRFYDIGCFLKWGWAFLIIYFFNILRV